MLQSSFDQAYRLGRKTVHGKFVIPSGIRCTNAATIRKCFAEVPPVGVITTKSISFEPRKGYREPIYARYAPGCYINAVGLSNPGAQHFVAEFQGIEIPADKFLLVSIFGSDVESFVAAARTLAPIADGFELNMSCPHAKGYGAEVGQDLELLGKITAVIAVEFGVPVFVKLSAIHPCLTDAARIAISSGAAGITVTNTIGPALSAIFEDEPILSNKAGGLSGDGIRPLGLRAVQQIRKAIGSEPRIIGMGGIASANHVRQYACEGADLFGIGSALTGLDSRQMIRYFDDLQAELTGGASGVAHHCSCESRLPMNYTKTRIASKIEYGPLFFKLIFEELPRAYSDGDLAGMFFFLCQPGVGEKPFAIHSACEKSVVVRVVGEFTRRLAALPLGAEVLLRGPYGAGVPAIESRTLVCVAGGTGIASILEIAQNLRERRNRFVFLFGARSSDQLFDLERFEGLGDVQLATDDGSAGLEGYASDLLMPAVARMTPEERKNLTFVICGPEPMVRKCFDIARQFASTERIIASIEYLTSCGVGICGKCSSPSGTLTCIDGPFLPWREFQHAG